MWRRKDGPGYIELNLQDLVMNHMWLGRERGYPGTPLVLRVRVCGGASFEDGTLPVSILKCLEDIQK